jgi:hypothetical protein
MSYHLQEDPVINCKFYYVSSVSDPDPVRSPVKLGRDPDPYSESGSRIQMYKNRLKKSKFTVTDFKDEKRKML